MSRDEIAARVARYAEIVRAPVMLDTEAPAGPNRDHGLPRDDHRRALVAADAIRIVTGHERGDLRVCNADDCRMLYLAHGRRARRWCSSERCGNRSRVAAHRARAAGKRAATRGEVS
jgi:predicted RNA-binding Zn ribbon-like protein